MRFEDQRDVCLERDAMKVFNRQKWPSFQPALTDVFAAEPENRIAREERGGGKTSVVGSPM